MNNPCVTTQTMYGCPVAEVEKETDFNDIGWYILTNNELNAQNERLRRDIRVMRIALIIIAVINLISFVFCLAC